MLQHLGSVACLPGDVYACLPARPPVYLSVCLVSESVQLTYARTG